MMSSGRKYNDHYDFAIIGAGLSGLTLVMALLENINTAGKKILLLDRSFQGYAPRTWCFWEQGEGKWDDLVEKTWPSAELFEGDDHMKFDLSPFTYKMVSSERFRKKAWSVIQRYTNVTVKATDVDALHPMSDLIWISTPADNFTASMVFDSRYELPARDKYKGHLLYQQFAGWWVHSDQPVFDPQVARLMDFRVKQQDAVAFSYLLPVDAHSALVEYTLFTSGIRQEKSLESALRDYLFAHFPGKHLEISSGEKGIIPMSVPPAISTHPRIVPIGTAGGCTKPSTGYTFMFVLQHTEQIIDALNKGDTPGAFNRLLSGRFAFYDRVLLSILEKYPQKGAKLFFRMFERNIPGTILNFLRNQTTLREEIPILMNLPWHIFIPAALKEIAR